MKTLALESFLTKLQAFRPAILLKKRLQHRCFPVNISKFLRTPIFKNIWKGLLLRILTFSVRNLRILRRTRNLNDVFLHRFSMCVFSFTRLSMTIPSSSNSLFICSPLTFKTTEVLCLPQRIIN